MILSLKDQTGVFKRLSENSLSPPGNFASRCEHTP